MIKHVVCFKFKDEYKKCAEEAVEVLLSMRGRVPSAKRIEAHADELRSARSCDVILEVELEDFAALEEYQRDPYHVDVVKEYMHKKTATSVAADFTINLEISEQSF